MLKNLWNTLKLLAASRKVMLAFISALAMLGGKLGLDLSTEAMAAIVSPIWVAIFGIAHEDAAAKKALPPGSTIASKTETIAVSPPGGSS